MFSFVSQLQLISLHRLIRKEKKNRNCLFSLLRMKETKKDLPDLRVFPEGASSFSHKFSLVPRHGYCFDPFRVHGSCRHKFSSARPESRANNLFGGRRHPPPSPACWNLPRAWPIVMQIEVTPAASYRANFHRYLAGSS